MPAIITSTGTWTVLSTDLSPFRLAPQSTTAANTASLNTPQVANLISTDFATAAARNNVPSEVFRVIELFALGFGTASGVVNQANRLSFWSSAALLRAWLNAVFSGQIGTDPIQSTSVARPVAVEA